MRRNLVLMLAVSFLLLFAGTAFAVDQVYFTEPAGDLFIPAIPGNFQIHMMFDFTSQGTRVDSLSAMVGPFTFTGSTVDALVAKTCNTAGWFAGSALNIFDSKICRYDELGAGLAPDKQMVNGLRFMDPAALVPPGTGNLLAVWEFTASAEGQVLCMDSTYMNTNNRLKWVTTTNRAIFPQYAATCWTIKKIPNQPPVVTCPAAFDNYHGPATGVLTATDNESDPLTAVVSFGALVPAGYGVWNWTANFDGQPLGAMNVIFTVSDGNASVPCTTVVTVKNTNPQCNPNGPYTVAHGVAVSFAVAVQDNEGDPVSLALTSGPGGLVGLNYSWTPGCADLGPNDVVFTATDDYQGSSTCQTTITVTNAAPTIVCPVSGNFTLGKDYAFTAGDADDVIGVADIGTTHGTIGGGPEPNFIWTPTVVGNYSVTLTVTDACGATAQCSFTANVTAFENHVVIGTPPCAEPGAIVTVPITFDYATFLVGGFEFEIEFDPTSLYFIRAAKGADILSWDYFTYRQLPCPSCGCCKYKLELLGIAEMPNGNDPHCPQGGELVLLTFQVANDNNLRGYCIPICFEFEDAYCTENVISDCTGNDLYVATKVYWDDCDPLTEPELITEDPLHPWFPQSCLPAHEPLDIFRELKFFCGGVKVCPVGGECVIGDINLNGVKYEVGDAVLFANYFIHGPNVFSSVPADRSKQIAATDVNRDGRTLTISDLVYLVRVILKDAVPLPKLTPYVNTLAVTNTAGVISANTEVPVGAAVFVFKGVGTPTLSANMEMLYSNNGTETRVLVWSSNGKSFSSGDVFSISGNVELTSIEAADRIGNALNTTFSKGIAKADRFELSANYPNPFNLKTTISFAVKTDSKVSLKVYNVSGQYVKTLVDETMSAGSYTTTWDGTNYAGEVVSSGIYFYKMIAGGFSSTQKMVLMK